MTAGAASSTDNPKSATTAADVSTGCQRLGADPPGPSERLSKP
jgi:hypothetical protein